MNFKLPESDPTKNKPEHDLVKEAISVADFKNELDEQLANSFEQNKIPQIILISYNRIGDEQNPGKVLNKNVFIDIMEGGKDYPLDEAGLDEFLKVSQDKIEKKLTSPNPKASPPIIIIYAGEGEKFNKVGAMIDNISQTTMLMGGKEENKPKIFILSCACNHDSKIESVQKLIETERLDGLICRDLSNPADPGCGGMSDMQDILTHIEQAHDNSSTIHH